MKEVAIILIFIIISINYAKVITVTDTNFILTLSSYSDTKLLLVFYSNSCSHCHDFLPEFSKLSQKFKDNAVFGKINRDEEKELVKTFDIQFVPSLYLIVSKQYYYFGETERTENNIKHFIE